MNANDVPRKGNPGATPNAYQRPLPSRAVFLAHVARNFAIGSGIIALSLGVGVLGYHGLAGLPWLDALLNAAMILTRTGPVEAITTTRGKVFATFYALFSGIALGGVAATCLGSLLSRYTPAAIGAAVTGRGSPL